MPLRMRVESIRGNPGIAEGLFRYMHREENDAPRPIPVASLSISKPAHSSDLRAMQGSGRGAVAAVWDHLYEWARELSTALRRDAGLLLLTLLYTAIGLSIALPLFLLLILYSIRFCLLHRPKRPIQALWSDIRTNLLTPTRISGALPCLLLLPLFAG